MRSLAIRLAGHGLRLPGGARRIVGRTSGPQLRSGPRSGPAPEVSILIVLSERSQEALRRVEAIAVHVRDERAELIVVDDSGSGGSQPPPWPAHVRLVLNARRRGLVRSLNQGARLARGDWLVLADGDTEVSEGWLLALLSAASAPGVAVVTPRYLNRDGLLLEAGAGIRTDGRVHSYGGGHDPAHFRFGFRRETTCGSIGALLVCREVWLRQGGLDEAYVSADHAVADLCLAASRLGLRIVYEPTATIVRPKGARMEAGRRRALGRRLSTVRDRLLILSRWQPELEALPSGRELRSNRPRALVVADRIPVAGSEGSPYTLEVLEALRGLGVRVTFLPEDLVAAQPTTARLQALGVEVMHGALDLDAELAERAGELQLIILSGSGPSDRWTARLRRLAPQASIAHAEPDLHWLREQDARSPVAAAPAGLVALREVDIERMRTADALLVSTRQEAEALRSAAVHATVASLTQIDACLRVLLARPGRVQETAAA